MWVNRTAKIVYFLVVLLVLVGAALSANLNPRGLPGWLVFFSAARIILTIFILIVPFFRQGTIKGTLTALGFLRRHLLLCATVFCVLIIAVQVLLIATIRANPGFDPGHMMDIVRSSLQGGAGSVGGTSSAGATSVAGATASAASAASAGSAGITASTSSAAITPDPYLSEYPNNQLFYLLIYAISYLTGGPQNAVLDLCNMFCIDLSILLTAFAAARRFGRYYGYATLFCGGFLAGLSPLVLVPYTDTMVLPLVSGGLLVLAFYRADLSLPKQLVVGLLLGVISVLAYLMKPSALVPFIAAAIAFMVWFLISWHRRKKEKENWAIRAGFFFKSISLVLVFLIAFSGCSLLFTRYIDTQQVFVYQKEMRLPLTHYLMMGVSEPDGGYNTPDLEATRAAGDYDQKVAYNISVIKTRLEDLGFGGYMGLLARKFTASTSDGSFFFRGEGGSPLAKDLNLQGWLPQGLAQVFFSDGDYFHVYPFYAQLVWLVVLALMLFSVKGKDPFTFILWITFIGGLICILLFQGGNTSYLIQFIPIFSILAAFGLGALVSNLRAFITSK